MLIRNVDNNLKVDTAYNPRRRESSDETVLKRDRSIAFCGDLAVEEAADL
jgi:hypothetical protein